MEEIRIASGISIRRDIVKMVEEKEVVYQRELQVYLEDKYGHWDVYNELRKLENRYLWAKGYRGRKWYWLAGTNWSDIKDKVDKIADLMDIVNSHPRKYNYLNIEYLDYAEFLVERAFMKAGYIVVSKDTYYFNGVIYKPPGPGRPPDLDFIVNIPEKQIFIGCEVKNLLRYPKPRHIDLFLEITATLKLKPLLIARMAHQMQVKRIVDSGGKVILFKRLILQPPFPKDVFNKLTRRGLPISVYTRVPDFLVNRLTMIRKMF